MIAPLNFSTIWVEDIDTDELESILRFEMAGCRCVSATRWDPPETCEACEIRYLIEDRDWSQLAEYPEVEAYFLKLSAAADVLFWEEEYYAGPTHPLAI